MAYEFFDPAIRRLKEEMRLDVMAQTIHSQNIANANNPKYIPQSFDRVLQKAIERQVGSHVVLEDELKGLSEASMHYGSTTRLLTAKLNIIRTVISQGRR